MVNLYIRLPEVGEKREAHTLEVLHADVGVEDPGVLPLDAQIHGVMLDSVSLI